MSWQIFILISILLYSITNIVQRSLLKDTKISPFLFGAYIQLSTAVFIGLFGLVFGNMSFPNIQPFIGNLLLMTMFYGLGNVFLNAALKRIEASYFAIIFSSRVLFTIITSSFLLNERLTIQQLIGTCLILSGIVVINIRRGKWQFGKGEFFALLLSACFGFQLTNDSFMLKSFPLYPYTFLSFLLPGIFLSICSIPKISQVSLFFEKKLLGKMFLISFLTAVGVVTFYQALQLSGNSSQIGAMSLLTVIITVLLAILFLKERDNIAKKILGAILSILGLLLVNA